MSSTNVDSAASDIRPRKRKVPINNNGEAVNIPKITKRKKAASPPAQPSAHTSSKATLKKGAKSKTRKAKPARQAPTKKPAAPAVDEDVPDDTTDEDSEPDSNHDASIPDASDEEPKTPEVPDVVTNEEELGL